MILHLSIEGVDETLCGKMKCRAAPRGWMDVRHFPNQPADGDNFVTDHAEWEWCPSCRAAALHA